MKQLNRMGPRLILETYSFSEAFYIQYIKAVYDELADLGSRKIPPHNMRRTNFHLALYVARTVGPRISWKILVKQIRELSELERVMAGLVDDSV